RKIVLAILRVAILRAPEQAGEPIQSVFIATADEPARISVGSDAQVRVAEDSLDAGEARLGVAGIGIGQDVRRERIAEPGADGPGRCFLIAPAAKHGIALETGEVIVAKGAEDPVAGDLQIAATADGAEPAAATLGDL